MGNQKLRRFDHEDKKQLLYVFEYGVDINIINVLSQMQNIDDVIKHRGLTPLILACCSPFNYCGVVNYLIERKVKVNKQCEENWSPMMYAANQGHVEIINMLINANADINVVDKYKYSALSIASSNGNEEVVKLLIRAGVDFGKCKDSIYFAARNSHLEIVKMLTTAGININIFDKDGWTSLHWAVFQKNNVLIEFLLEQGADEGIKNNEGKMAIELTDEEDIKNIFLHRNNFVLK